MKDCVGIFGTSGMAREAGDIAWQLGLNVIYVARDDDNVAHVNFAGKVILESHIDQYKNMPFVIGVGENTIRQAIAERFKGSLRFVNLIHPSSTFGQGQREVLERCQGVIIAAGARFTSGIQVGDFSIFNQNITIGHDCIIDSYVHVAPGANVSGNVHLSECSWVGAGAVVNQGLYSKKRLVGKHALIGSGAVVIKDCEAHSTYVGMPAKRIK